MTKYFCDKCGKELVGDVSQLFKVKIGYGNPIEDESTSWMDHIYCDSCGELIHKKIDDAIGITTIWC